MNFSPKSVLETGQIVFYFWLIEEFSLALLATMSFPCIDPDPYTEPGKNPRLCCSHKGLTKPPACHAGSLETLLVRLLGCPRRSLHDGTVKKFPLVNLPSCECPWSNFLRHTCDRYYENSHDDFLHQKHMEFFLLYS